MPTRSCIICRKKDEKSNLFRIISDNNIAILDKSQKINKRAVYLCKDIKCIEKAENSLKKGKLKVKIGINKDSFEVLLNDVKNELGE